MITDSQIVCALCSPGLELHPWDLMQRSVTCQVPTVQMRVNKLWGERVEVDLQKQNKTIQLKCVL